MVQNVRPDNNSKRLCQIAETCAKIDGFGEVDISFGILKTTLHQRASIHNNPHSTKGRGALTHIQQLQLVQHTMHKPIKLIDPIGKTYQ